LPNIRQLESACRCGGIEIVYSVIENMTRDGRDRSLDCKISGIDVPYGSWAARVLDEIAPLDDEMIFRKTSSNVVPGRYDAMWLDHAIRTTPRGQSFAGDGGRRAADRGGKR
jgi:nicotinamidase-related amidase